MLQGDVQIGADLGVVSHLSEHVLREISRIGIMYPDPFYALHRGKFFNQFREGAAVIKVQAVECRILRDQDEFLDSF